MSPCPRPTPRRGSAPLGGSGHPVLPPVWGTTVPSRISAVTRTGLPVSSVLAGLASSYLIWVWESPGLFSGRDCSKQELCSFPRRPKTKLPASAAQQLRRGSCSTPAGRAPLVLGGKSITKAATALTPHHPAAAWPSQTAPVVPCNGHSTLTGNEDNPRGFPGDLGEGRGQSWEPSLPLGERPTFSVSSFLTDFRLALRSMETLCLEPSRALSMASAETRTRRRGGRLNFPRRSSTLIFRSLICGRRAGGVTALHKVPLRVAGFC